MSMTYLLLPNHFLIWSLFPLCCVWFGPNMAIVRLKDTNYIYPNIIYFAIKWVSDRSIGYILGTI